MLLMRVLLLSMLAVTVMSYMSEPLLKDRFTKRLRLCRKKQNCCTDRFSLQYLNSIGRFIGMQLHCCNDTEYLPTFQTCSNNVISDKGNRHRACNGLPYNDTTHACCPATYGAVALPSCQTDGTFEDECDCQKYYICKGGQRKSAKCLFGENWNSRLEKCETERARVEDQCRLRPYRKIGIARIRMQVYLPVCRLYHSCCSGSRKYISQHAPGLLHCCGSTEYVPAHQTCENDENIFNNIRDSQLCYNLPYNNVTHACCDLYRGPVELPKCTKDGVYEDMCDCQKYYVCKNGRRTSHSCPSSQYLTRTGTALTCQKHYKNLFQICLSRLYHQNVLVQMEVPYGWWRYIRKDDYKTFLLRNCRLHEYCCQKFTSKNVRSAMKLGCCGKSDYNPEYQECHQNALRDLGDFPKCHGRPYNSTTAVCCEVLRQPVALPTCQKDGKFRDECDCGKYYECSGGRRERKECEEGKWFNELPGSSRCLTAFPDVRRQCDVRPYSPDVDISVKVIDELVGACDDISVPTDRKGLLDNLRKVRGQLLAKIRELKREYGESIKQQKSSTRVLKDSKSTMKTITYTHPAAPTFGEGTFDAFSEGDADPIAGLLLKGVSKDLAQYFVTVRLSLLESEFTNTNVFEQQIKETASLLLHEICFLRRLSGSSLDDFNLDVDLKLLDIAKVWTHSTPTELKSWVHEMYTKLHCFVEKLLL